MLLAIQYGLGGLGIMLLPRLVPIYGHGVLFGALIAFSFVTLLMLPFLDSYPRGRIVRPVASGGIRWGLLAATVASVFLFQAGNMGIAVYLIPLARAFGLETGYASTALGLATWVGIAGCALVVIFGTRFGRTWPLAIGAVLDHRRHARLPLERVADCLSARELPDLDHLVVRDLLPARHVRGVRPDRPHRGARRAALEARARLRTVRGRVAARGCRLRDPHQRVCDRRSR